MIRVRDASRTRSLHHACGHRSVVHKWPVISYVILYFPGFQRILESPWIFFLLNSRPFNWKYLKTGQVLESPWIHQVKLRDIANFVKQVFCLKQDLLIIVMFCFYRAACNAAAVLWWDFCSSVHLSVCHTRVLWQNGRKIGPDLYTIRKNIYPSFLRR